ncbi:MAG TPA: protein kinase [Thermoanaerobaculia bacterium]|nr:protein kinase [Thermoanaerobaculia bacterium]
MTQLGHYQLLRQLGAGGMGEVYLADDTRLGRKVAIKLLPADLARDEEAKRRLLREARSVAALDHPNVCAVHEVDEEDGRMYIVMQYVEGETLADKLSRSSLKLSEAIEIAMPIASALQEAHTRGVVHRDIKPANVMINTRGQVKVLDFGLAKAFARAEQSATDMMVSKTGTISGTAPYMSPEQIRGEPVDGRTDIFSLGIVLYEIAAGKRPFDRPSAVATITSILFDPPPPLERSEFAPLEPVIRRCLAKNPSDRYQNAKELLDDLLAVREGEAIRSNVMTRHAAVQQRSIDPEVEQLILKGRAQWNKRHPEAVKQGIALFQEAIERDPSQARAYAGLADCYNMLAFLQVVPPLDVLARTKAAAFRAIELDPSLPEPHASLGYAAGLFEWDWPAAEREMGEAMRLDPNYAWAPHWFGLLLTGRGRIDEAIAHMRRARELDPLSPIISVALGIPYHYGRRYSEALTHYHRVIETDANFAPAHYYIGLTYEQLGEYEQAEHHFERSNEISGRTSFFLASLAHCHGVHGNRDSARREFDELRLQMAHRYVSPLNFALIRFGLGDVDQGIRELELAFEERSAGLYLLDVEPRFDIVRDDPRFHALTAARRATS